MEALVLPVLTVMPVLVVIGGLYDLATMRIPNWISLSLVAVFFPAALISGLPLIDIGLHVGIGVVALLIGMGLFAMNWVGGGDAKLLAAGCLWLGWPGSGLFVLATAMVGGLFCLVLLLARAQLQILAPTAPVWAQRLLEPKGDIPYGVAIAIGALIAFPGGDMMARYAAGG